MILITGLISLAGVGQQEAFQILDNASGIFYALAYLVMFALPIANPRAPIWLRAAAASGFVVTLLYSILSIFPIIQVESWLKFGIKIGGVVVCANALGAGLFWLEQKKSLAANERK
jgi:hypothetical protein